tara:strand:- start:79 stop:321 length:243 start_codon:yes stop_codon:yes gene_type:complete
MVYKMEHEQDFKTELEKIQDDLTKVEIPTSDQQKDLDKLEKFLEHFDTKAAKIKTVEIGKSEFRYILGTKLKLKAFENYR